MAQDTFLQLWSRVLLYAPGVPVPLVQTFVKNAYNRALAMHYWSELYQDAELTVPAEYSTGTVAVVNGVASATLSGGAFTGLTGRQLKVGNSPTYYSITAVSGVGDITATLDRVYEGASASGLTFNVASYYLEFPSDLAALDDIRDINGNWRLRRQYHQANYLDRVDASRTSTGNPVLYVAAPPRVVAGVAYPRFEFWPRPSAGSKLSYRYIKNVALVANSDRIITMLPAEAVIAGALVECSMWPGTTDRPNPFFSPDTHTVYNARFEDLVHDGEMSDLDRSQRLLIYDDDNMGLPGDAAWLQSHGIPF
jgi:hypothetical protein